MKILKLSNGIETVLKPMPGYNSVTTGIWVRTGSRYESEAEGGCAHFLEHLLFKGTEKRTCEELKRLVEGVGGTFNAFTSEEATCYYIKMPFTKHLGISFDVLSDMVSAPLLPPEEVERERNVILEEIKMYQDMPDAYVHELFHGLVFPGHPLGRFIAGTAETVGGLTPGVLRDYWKRFYQGHSMVLSVTGSFEPEAAEREAERSFGVVPSGTGPDFAAVTGKEPGPSFHFLTKDTEQVHFCLGGRGVSDTDERRWHLSLMSVVLGGNMSSRLFVEVREKRGLAYQIGAGSNTFADTGLFLVEAGTSAGTLKEAVKIILAELARIRAEPVPAEELTRAKDFVIGQLNLRLESTSEYMSFLGGQLISRRKIKTPEEIVARINAVQAEDIRRIAGQILTRENLNLALIGPKKSEENLREMVTL